MTPALEGTIGAVHIVWALITNPVLRYRRMRWGVNTIELNRPYPGDELNPDPKWGYTHAVTIHAPAESVWPWLAQLGQEKGGFYSYEWLENLVGCDIHNADRIHNEYQTLQVGDGIRLHPNMPPLPIVDLEPNRYILLHGCENTDTHRPFDVMQAFPEHYLNVTWLFYIHPESDGTSRLISKFQIDYHFSLLNWLCFGPLLVEPVSYVMDRKMLLGIKTRVERPSSTR